MNDTKDIIIIIEFSAKDFALMQTFAFSCVSLHRDLTISTS
jgi:hypothetical protein